MSTARIDITGTFSDVHVDRTKPAILENYMSDMAWNKFCDDIDRSMQSISGSGKIIFGFTIFTFVVFGAAMALSFSGLLGDSGTYIFILPALSFPAFFVMVFLTMKRQKQMKAEVQQVLEDTSRTQPQLSFHWREEYGYSSGGNRRYNPYIEVSISGGAVNPYTSQASPFVASSAPKDVATRLQDLEKVKHLLTDQEYEDKRRDILNDV